MKIENIDIQATIERAQALIGQHKQLSESTRSMFELLIVIITVKPNPESVVRLKTAVFCCRQVILKIVTLNSY